MIKVFYITRINAPLCNIYLSFFQDKINVYVLREMLEGMR